MQKVIVIGHVGKDAVVSRAGEKSVINFNVCHSEKRKVNGVQEDVSQWFNCSYFTDKTAIAPYIKKGGLVYIEGKVDIHTYTDAQGVARYNLKVLVNQVQLLGSKTESNEPAQQAQQQPSKGNFIDHPNDFEENLPF